MWMSHTAAQSGKDVVLYCRGYGTPPLQIEWLNPQGNEIVPFTDGKHQVSTGKYNYYPHVIIYIEREFIEIKNTTTKFQIYIQQLMAAHIVVDNGYLKIE